MSERLMDVNAYTTLDLVEATAHGHGWWENGLGTLDASLSEDGEAVVLEYELDSMSVERLPQHAVRLRLSEADARELADDIKDCVEEIGEGER